MKICPQCDLEFSEGNFCSNDGTPLIEQKPLGNFVRVCSKCNSEFNEGSFCPNDGSPLIEKSTKIKSLVGSQKILAGGDVNQNITYNSETKIYHQNENSEKENTYRKMVTKCFENDHILDRTERQFLDAEALKIGLPTETKNKIEAEVRSRSVSHEDEKLSSVDVANLVETPRLLTIV
jgi:DNA-directed RNA polymerase subunit M/transcription elongation factor TFIIS